jgi:hypothetical protein
MGETNYSSGDQRHDHCAVLDIIPRPEGVVPVIEEF